MHWVEPSRRMARLGTTITTVILSEDLIFAHKRKDQSQSKDPHDLCRTLASANALAANGLGVKEKRPQP